MESETLPGALSLVLLIFHSAVFFIPSRRLPSIVLLILLVVPFILLVVINFFVWIFCLCCKKDYDDGEDDVVVDRNELQLPIDQWEAEIDAQQIQPEEGGPNVPRANSLLVPAVAPP